MASRNRPQKGESMLLQKKNKKKRKEKWRRGWADEKRMNEWMNEWTEEWMNGWMEQRRGWCGGGGLPFLKLPVELLVQVGNDFDRFPPAPIGPYRVLPGFTEFYRVLFHFVWFAQGCIGFYWVLLGFAGSWVSSSWKLVFTGFHSIKTGFYWVLD